MKEIQYFLYIMTNYTNTTLYTGVTNDLVRRVWEHKYHFNNKSFTTKYFIHKLVYYEIFKDINQAIAREKQLKAGPRRNKIKLIEKTNPQWNDLYESFKV